MEVPDFDKENDLSLIKSSSSSVVSSNQTKTGDEIREEARCLEIQDIMATKVIKHGKMCKRKGLLCA